MRDDETTGHAPQDPHKDHTSASYRVPGYMTQADDISPYITTASTSYASYGVQSAVAQRSSGMEDMIIDRADPLCEKVISWM